MRMWTAQPQPPSHAASRCCIRQHVISTCDHVFVVTIRRMSLLWSPAQAHAGHAPLIDVIRELAVNIPGTMAAGGPFRPVGGVVDPAAMSLEPSAES